MVGIWNIIMGLAAIAAGASGQVYFPFAGANSSIVLIVLGGIFVIWGITQIVRNRRAS
jgi:hypothetical protein